MILQLQNKDTQEKLGETSEHIDDLNLLVEIRDVEYVGAYVIVHFKPVKVTNQEIIDQLREIFPENEFRRDGLYLG